MTEKWASHYYRRLSNTGALCSSWAVNARASGVRQPRLPRRWAVGDDRRPPGHDLWLTQRTVNRAISAAPAPVYQGVGCLRSWRIFRKTGAARIECRQSSRPFSPWDLRQRSRAPPRVQGIRSPVHLNGRAQLHGSHAPLPPVNLLPTAVAAALRGVVRGTKGNAGGTEGPGRIEKDPARAIRHTLSELQKRHRSSRIEEDRQEVLSTRNA